MTFAEFRKYVAQNAMYETIYTSSDGQSILVITMLDAFVLMNKIKGQNANTTKEQKGEKS